MHSARLSQDSAFVTQHTRFRVTHSKQEHSNSADLMTHLFNQAKLVTYAVAF